MLKRILKSALVLIACLLVLISFLPMLLSVSQVNQFLISCVNKRIAGKFHAQEILVGWTDGISIKGLQIHDPQGREVALFKKVSCDVALLSLIHAPAIEGRIQVDSPKISLIDDNNNGHFSLEEVLHTQTPVTQETAATNSPKTELILTDLHLAIDIQPQGQAKVNLLCQIENSDNGQVEKGSINLTATAQNFEELEKAYTSALQQSSSTAASVVSLDCYVDQFPLKAIVPFVCMKDPKLAHLIVPALGNKITAKIAHTLRGDELGLTLLLNSPQLSTKLKAAVKGNAFSIKDEGSLSWKLRPELFEAITQKFSEYIPQDIEQLKTTTLQATIQPQSGTLGLDGKMPLAISWNLDSPLVLTSPSWSTPLACTMLGSITASCLQESLEAYTQVSLATGSDKTSLDALCTINDPLQNPETICKATLNGPIAAQAGRFLKQQLPLVELLGRATNLTANCTLTEREKTAEVQMQSETIKANLAFALEQDHIKVAPSTFSLNLHPEAFIPKKEGFEFSNVPLALSITSAEIPFDIAAFTKDMTVEANLAIDSCTATLASGPVELINSSIKFVKNKSSNLVVTTNTTANRLNQSFECNAVVPVQIDDKKITLSTTDATLRSQTFLAYVKKMNAFVDLESKEASGNLLLQSDTTSVETSFFVKQGQPSNYTLLPAASLLLEGSMKDFPVELLALFTQKPALPDLLGKSLEGKWKIGFNNTLSREPIHLSLRADGVAIDANFELAKELSGRDCLTVDYELTPKRFAALQSMFLLAQSEQQKEMRLASSAKLHARVKGLKVPLEQFVDKDKPLVLAALLDALWLDTHVSVQEISLTQKDKKNLTISPLQITAELSGKDRQVSFSCQSDKSAQAHAAEITINGTAHNLWNEQGFQFDNARILLDTKIHNLPLDIFHSFTQNPQTANQLTAVLGHTLDANLKGEIKDLDEGTFYGTIKSSRLQSEVACRLNEGILTLEKPITAQYTLTPEAGEVLLKDVNPLLVTAAKSESPITLTIDSKDFSVPLKPFSLDTVTMKNIKIEPGVLTCKNGGMLSLLVSLLKVPVSSSNEINLWFTPIYVEVKGGIVDCKRSDALLANAFPIATWGKIDLIHNKINMMLGLSGTAIARAFDIPKLDPGYMVQIPIHGTTQSPKIDSALATTKITALKLQQHKSNTTSLIGGLLEVATTIVEKDAPIPPPTTQPFPWAKHR